DLLFLCWTVTQTCLDCLGIMELHIHIKACEHVKSLQVARRVVSLILSLAFGVPAYPAVPNSSTYVGDNHQESVRAIAVDTAGNTYLAGTRCLDGPPQIGAPGNRDLFVIKQNVDGGVVFSVSAGIDYASALAADSRGNIYIAGTAISAPAAAGLLIKLN